MTNDVSRCGWCGGPTLDGPKMCYRCRVATQRRARAAASQELRKHYEGTTRRLHLTLEAATEEALKWMERKGYAPWTKE